MMLAVGHKGGLTTLFDAATGETRWEVQAPAWPAAPPAPRPRPAYRRFTRNPVAMSPDGRFVASAESGKRRDRTLLRDAQTSSVCMTTADHDGAGACICREDDEGRLWVQPACPVEVHASEVEVMQFSPCGQTLATGDSSGGVILWDVLTGKAKFRTESVDYAAFADVGCVSSLSFSADGARLAGVVSDDWATLAVWETSTGGLVQCWYFGEWLQGYSTQMEYWLNDNYVVDSMQFNPGSNSVLAMTLRGGGEDVVEWWDLDSGKMQVQVSEHMSGPLVFSADGRSLAAVWDADSVCVYRCGEPLSSQTFTQDVVFVPVADPGIQMPGMLLSADGSMLAMSRNNGSVVLVNAWTGQLLRTVEQGLVGRTERCACLACGPDWATVTQRGSAFAMGHHPRLGAASRVLLLDAGVLRMILDRV